MEGEQKPVQRFWYGSDIVRVVGEDDNDFGQHGGQNEWWKAGLERGEGCRNPGRKGSWSDYWGKCTTGGGVKKATWIKTVLIESSWNRYAVRLENLLF